MVFLKCNVYSPVPFRILCKGPGLREGTATSSSSSSSSGSSSSSVATWSQSLFGLKSIFFYGRPEFFLFLDVISSAWKPIQRYRYVRLHLHYIIPKWKKPTLYQWVARSSNSKLVPRKYCRQTVQGQTAWLSTRVTSGYSANEWGKFLRDKLRLTVLK